MLQKLSSSWEVRGTPTFFFVRDGGELDKLVGCRQKGASAEGGGADLSIGPLAPKLSTSLMALPLRQPNERRGGAVDAISAVVS